MVRGDLGPSFQYPDYRVSELLAAAMPITVLNGSLALLMALGLGVPLGVWAALRAGSWTDRVLMFGAGLGLSSPKFVVAPLLVLVFAVGLQWLPAGGWDGSWRSVVLPVIALALPNLAYCARLTRASLLDVLGADYLRAARLIARAALIVSPLLPTEKPILPPGCTAHAGGGPAGSSATAAVSFAAGAAALSLAMLAASTALSSAGMSSASTALAAGACGAAGAAPGRIGVGIHGNVR